jgi:hypothetical protein
MTVDYSGQLGTRATSSQIDVQVSEWNDSIIQYVIKSNGEPLDISELEIQFYLKASPRAEDNPDRKLSSLDPTQIEKTDATGGQIRVKIPGEWLPYSTQFYRLDIVQSADSPQTGRGTAITGYIYVRDT